VINTGEGRRQEEYGQGGGGGGGFEGIDISFVHALSYFFKLQVRGSD